MESGSFMNVVEETKRPGSALSLSGVKFIEGSDIFPLHQVDECFYSSAPISTSYRETSVSFDSLQRRVSIETSSSLQPLVPVKSSKWTIKRKLSIVFLIIIIIALVCIISVALAVSRKNEDDGGKLYAYTI